MVSLREGDAAERDTPTLPVVAIAPAATGFETSKPVRTAFGVSGPLVSVQAPNKVTQANAMLRRRSVPSARTPTPLSGRPYATDTMWAFAHRLPPVLTNPAQ